MDFSGLDAFLRTKTRAAPPQRPKPRRADRTKVPYTSLPEVLKEILEEQSRQYKAYQKAKEWEIDTYRDEYPSFNKFYRIIKREEKTACLISPGLLDLDLVDVIVRLKLAKLPSRVRRMAMSLCATLERKVTQRETGFPFNDPLPFPTASSRGQLTTGVTSSSGTLTEVRNALCLT